jgi:hypothetical protein
MHDHFSELFEYDEHGNKRRKQRMLPDGATMHVPMGFYDGGFRQTFADGSPDFTSPHRKGFRFSDVDDEASIAADQAYEERSRRMESAWKRKGQPDEGNDPTALTPPSKEESAWLRKQALARQATREVMGGDDAQRMADQAYEERNKRLANAWRHD